MTYIELAGAPELVLPAPLKLQILESPVLDLAITRPKTYEITPELILFDDPGVPASLVNWTVVDPAIVTPPS